MPSNPSSDMKPVATVVANIILPFPLGSILPYAGPESSLGGLISTGWMQCDGSAISRSTYKPLFDLLQTMYGAGDGATTFNLPDFRQVFLRAVGTGNLDPDNATRTGLVVGDPTVVGPVVGSRQASQLLSHTHSWSGECCSTTSSGSDITAVLVPGSSGRNGYSASTDNGGGGNETRPINVYTYFLIFTGLPQTGE